MTSTQSPAALPQLAANVADLQTLLHGGNLLFAEALYDAWLLDPTSVPADWQTAFADLQRQTGRTRPPIDSGVALPDAKLSPEERILRVRLLRAWPALTELGDRELALVAEAGELLSLKQGEVLYREGEIGDSMVFVASGLLQVSRKGQPLHTLGAGQVSSELSLFFGQARTADVQAAEPTQLLELRRDRFDAVLDRAGPLARQMLHLVAGRLVEANARQERVDMLIRGYRVRGHVMASLNPLGGEPASHPELELAYYGLSDADLDTPFSCRSMSGAPILTLRQIITRLRHTYCGSIGVQYMHIDDPDVKDWLQHAMETTENRRELSREEQVRIFAKLAEAEVFENFLQKKFVGAKRFSLEGGESLIPLLDMALEAAAGQGVVEAVIGMAHRGRLNVLANIMGKDPRQIFREFEDKDPDLHIGRGDVKYHMGFTNWRTGQNGHKVKLQLCFNPSHLEFVGPVAVGRVRGRQDRLGDNEHRKVMPILIHGDAAFAGQGVVQELLNMSELPGYNVGGTVHIIVNNQIGFTTPPESSRSCRYATDVAKMLQVPIFHVNGEHPEGVAQVISLALEFRARFQRDVVIDMYCYRRHGHNEGDDPTFTQPLMYEAIRAPQVGGRGVPGQPVAYGRDVAQRGR
jgi:2-oxoglutarate dehydrogenase complex dehydrogenase (E1) component-like enzyme